MKGQIELSTLIMLALSLVVIVVLGVIIGGFIGVFNSEQTGQTCRLSIQAQLLTQFGGFPSPFDIYCPRKLILIEQDSATMTHLDVYAGGISDVLRGDFIKKLRSSDDYHYTSLYEDGDQIKARQPTISPEQEAFEEELPRVFSSELAECWDIFARGDKSVVQDTSDISRQETCVVCAEIMLARDFTPFDVNMNSEYNNPHAYTADDEAYALRDFLYDNERPSNSISCYTSHIRPTHNFRVEPGKTYAVVFLRSGSRGLTGENPVNEFIGALGFGWIHTDTETERSGLCQTVAVVPLDDIARTCDLVVN